VRSPILRTSVVGGVIAGTIDIGAACLINGKGVDYVLHVIAGGILGKSSFSGGMGTAVLGLVLQWLMSIVIAAIFVIVARMAPQIARGWWWAGLAYGVPVFVVMNFVVFPLSAWRLRPSFTAFTLVENVLAMMLFGFIVALTNRVFARPRAL
jgi:hypothetical protein